MFVPVKGLTPMKATLYPLLVTLAVTFLPASRADEKEKPRKEKDILNYAAQKAAGKDVKKIVFIGDKRPHGPRGNHEFLAGAAYLAKTINGHYDNAYAVVYPQDQLPKDLAHADCVIVLLNHGG